MKKTVCIAGHFNPVHIGHLKMIQEARKLGDRLFVIVANDEQARKKRHNIFMPVTERMEILNNIAGVDKVILSIDTDEGVCKTLAQVNPDIFASGCDDSHPDALKEQIVCDKLGIKTVYNVGGKKIRSSSYYLSNYVENAYVFPAKKVKEIEFFTPDHVPLQVGMHEPSKEKVSKFHRHTRIAELLYVEKGKMTVTLTDNDWNELETKVLKKGESILLLGGGHQVVIEKGSRILEVKSGAYIDDKIWK